MVKFSKIILNSKSGFTLIEVMIAITIFAMFSTAFVLGFGQSLVSSGSFKEEIFLKDIAENKINEIIVSPPTLSDSLTLSNETKEVEYDNNYETIVKYKKFVAPDFAKLMSNEDTLNQSESDKQQAQLAQKISEVYKKNLETILWQVEVTARNKTTDQKLKLSTWIFNHSAKVDIGIL